MYCDLLFFFFFCAAAVAFENRIIGGRDTVIEHRPYQVSFELLYGKHYCGGSIISPIYIVTAAHCKILANDTRVRLKTSKVHQGGVLHSIKTVTTHPNYDRFSPYDCDIAIVELEDPIEFSDAAQPIPLAKKSDKLSVGTIVSVSGWGFLSPKGASPVQLQIVEVPIVDHEQCALAIAALDGNKEMTDTMICAGNFEHGGKDACLYDSGGPLVAEGKLYGIVSWGKGCARPGFPGVYSNVAFLRNFITRVTGL